MSQTPPSLLLLARTINPREKGRSRILTRQGVHSHRTFQVIFRPKIDANVGTCRPARPKDAPVKRQGAIAPTSGAEGAPTSRLHACRYKTRRLTREREGSRRRHRAEVRAAVAGGGSKISKTVKGNENNAIIEVSSSRERQGVQGGSARLCTHRVGTAGPGILRRLGALQQRSAPQWGDIKLQILADTMENDGSHARTVLRWY